MKRKILILICAVCLVLSFSVTAFASSAIISTLPDGDFVIHEYNGTYVAVPCEQIISHNGSSITYSLNGYTLKYLDNEWVRQDSTSNATSNWNMEYWVYDTTGRYGISNILDRVSFDDLTSYYDGLKGQITVQNVVGVLVVGVGAVIGIVFMYWGIRKGVKALMSAFRKGKISL